jgi:predicted DNA-binding transcriptional regulator AlpA
MWKKNNSPYIKVGALARLVGLHPSVIGMLILKEDLPAPKKVGQGKAFLRSEVSKWVREREK